MHIVSLEDNLHEMSNSIFREKNGIKIIIIKRNQRRQINYVYFISFFQKIGLDISCKLSASETICMKCLILSSWNI